MASKKAETIATQLIDSWEKKVKATLPIIVRSADSSGNPVITLSADSIPAAGEKVVIVVIKPYSTGVSYDVFGNTAPDYAPHIIQICTELNFAGTTDNIADILTPVELLPILADVARTGCIIEWHQTANGTIPSTTAIAAGTALKKTDKDLYWNIQKAT